MQKIFCDRSEAGKMLAVELNRYAYRPDVIVLGLPRGGVPVGFEIARHLHVPLDILLVRKLGTPDCEELAMGAIASGGVRVINERVVRGMHIPKSVLDDTTANEQREIARREKVYRGHAGPLNVAGKTVILVDDGIATGASLLAALAALRHLHPARVVIAVPVAASSARREFAGKADEVVVLTTPDDFFAVGQVYIDFDPVSDETVTRLMAESRAI
jgi:putative phosphoribosyl transferase